jgi:hypothetical protein
MKPARLLLVIVALAVVFFGAAIFFDVVDETLGLVASFEAEGDSPVPAKTEVAMKPHSRITATTPSGTIIITSGAGLKRSYTWAGATRYVEMGPRTERWYGSMGIYWPGPGNHWKDHEGISRGVLEEGQQHFQTLSEAQKWIAERKSMTYFGRPYMQYVWRDDGLMVGWDKAPERKQLNVEVWQLIIDGEKPTSLPGSDNAKILVEQLTDSLP